MEIESWTNELDSLVDTDWDDEIESETRDADIEAEKLWDCDADSDDVIFR